MCITYSLNWNDIWLSRNTAVLEAACKRGSATDTWNTMLIDDWSHDVVFSFIGLPLQNTFCDSCCRNFKECKHKITSTFGNAKSKSPSTLSQSRVKIKTVPFPAARHIVASSTPCLSLFTASVKSLFSKANGVGSRASYTVTENRMPTQTQCICRWMTV